MVCRLGVLALLVIAAALSVERGLAVGGLYIARFVVYYHDAFANYHGSERFWLGRSYVTVLFLGLAREVWSTVKIVCWVVFVIAGTANRAQNLLKRAHRVG